MRYKISLGALFLALAQLTFAQFTNVTGTVHDPIGLPYANGTIAAVLNISRSPTFTSTGLPYTPPTTPATLDSNGNFTMQLADVTALSPGGGTWTFVVCSGPGSVPPSWGRPGGCFNVPTLTISGSSQNISTNIQGNATPLTYSASAILQASSSCAKLYGPVDLDTSHLDATGQATATASALSSANVIGVAVATSGIGCIGSVQVATSLVVPCFTDNSSTVGHTVAVSSSVTGECTDTGGMTQTSLTFGTVMRANSGSGAVSMVLLGLKGGGGGTAWGSITGTLSAQTDLQNALNLLAPLNSPTFTGTIHLPDASTWTASGLTLSGSANLFGITNGFVLNGDSSGNFAVSISRISGFYQGSFGGVDPSHSNNGADYQFSSNSVATLTGCNMALPNGGFWIYAGHVTNTADICGDTTGTSIFNPTLVGRSAHALLFGPSGSLPSPTTNGFWLCGFNVVASAGVDPSCALQGIPVNAQSGNYSLLFSDRSSLIKESGGTTSTLTLPQITGPTASNFPFVTANLNSGNQTITANAADSINGGSAGGSVTNLPNFLDFAYSESQQAPGNWDIFQVPTFQAFGATCGNGLTWNTSTGFGCLASGPVTSVGGQTGVVGGIGTGTKVEMTSDTSQTSGDILVANAGGAHDSGTTLAAVAFGGNANVGTDALWNNGVRGIYSGLPSSSTGTPANSTMYATPVIVQTPMLLGHETFYIATAGTSETMYGCTYNSNSNGTPNALIWSGNIAVNTSTQVRSISATQVTLSPGIYWVAYEQTGTTAAVAEVYPSPSATFSIVNANGNRIVTTANTVSGGICPSSLGTLTAESSTGIMALLLEP